MKGVSVILGAVVAAIAASACCLLPLLLGTAGAGTVGLGAALTPFRPYFIALSVLLLGAAFYFTYRARKADDDAGCCDVKSARARRISRVSLWIVTVFTVAALAYPYVAAQRARAFASERFGGDAKVSDNVQTAQFVIPSMDCPACAANISE